MSGTWQVKIVYALAHESPLRLRTLHGRCAAGTEPARQALKRAVRTLLAQGFVVRPARGWYALAADAEGRRRARRPPAAPGGGAVRRAPPTSGRSRPAD